MIIAEAEELARKLMAEWLHPVWKFGWSRSQTKIGECILDLVTPRYLIRLSRPFTLVNPREVVEETIRHEIAHALTYRDRALRGDRASHGPEWQANAIRVGARPEAYAGEEVTEPPRKWQATCPACGRVNGRHRWTPDMEGERACGVCCREHNDGEWDKRFVFVYSKIR